MNRVPSFVATLVVLAPLIVFATPVGCASGDRDPFAAAVADAGLARTTGPRLSGGFAYAPCRETGDDTSLVPPVRCSAAPAPLSDAAAAFDPLRRTPLRPHDAARLHLLFAGASGAARADALLLAAAAEAPGDARLLADRAVARTLLASERDDPFELVAALDLAIRASDLDPNLPEAAFNVAWLLDHLGLHAQARERWARYLESDPASAWAMEAERRIAALASTAPTPPPTGADPETGVHEDRQSARERVDELLGSWAAAHLEGDPSAEAHLRQAEATAAALTAAGGDRGALDSCQAVRHALDGAADAVHRLASGHHSYTQAGQAFARLEIEDAERRFRQAARQLAGSRSPARHWARVGLAGTLIYRNDGAGAEAILNDVLARVDEGRYPALAARVRWGLGLAAIRRGQFSRSLSLYRAALRGFESAGEDANRGALHTLIAENLRFLGHRREAWEHRFRASRLLAGGGELQRWHNALWEAAHAAREDGLPLAALAIQDEGVAVAGRLARPLLHAEALLWRSKIHLAAGRPGAARADLERARALGERSGSATMRRRLEADLWFAEAEVRRLAAPGDALPALDRAVAFYRRRELQLELVAALLSRAHGRAATRDDEAAAADLEAAIEIVEGQRIALDDDRQRRVYADTVQQLFDEAIALSVRQRQPAAETLAVVERARRVERSAGQDEGEPPALADDLERLRRGLAAWPADRALVAYAWLPDRLLVWWVHDRQVRLAVRTVDRDALGNRLDGFVASLRGGGPVEGADRRLFEQLMPAEVRALPRGVPLFVVPDRSLHALPFAALRDPFSARLLVEDRAIATAPSVLDLLRTFDDERRRRGEPLTGVTLVADPAFDRLTFPQLARLSLAAAQVQRIAPLYRQVDLLPAAAATRGELLARLGRRPVLHYYGHAIANPRQPGLSHLVLADDGDPATADVLYARDVEGERHAGLRLVVLSACDTMVTGDTRIGGLTGLARSFLDAGASAVVGTLWPVDERTAVALTTEFHRRLQTTGDAAEALRQAQLAMRGHQAGEPWSVFQLVGTVEVDQRGNRQLAVRPTRR